MGGTHNSTAVWWLSPDIQLVGATSGMDKADPGAANTVDVTLHNRGATNATTCTLPPGTESVTIELWMGNPSLAMAPNIAASTKHIDSIGVPIFGLGATASHQFTWTPPTGLPASDPQAQGTSVSSPAVIRIRSRPARPVRGYRALTQTSA